MSIEELKYDVLRQFKAFNDGDYVNISSVVPQLHKLLEYLRTDFTSLNEIPTILILQIEQKFGYILNSNNKNFDPIYIQSTFLNPIFYDKLSEQQIMKAKDSIEDLIYDQVFSQRIKVDDISEKSKFNEQNMSTARQYSNLLVQFYYDYVRTSHLTLKNLNVFEFWVSNYKTYGELAQLALDFLSIPITCTLPYDSVVNNSDSYGNSFGDDYSIKDPFDFIKMTQNVENLERNAIVRLNRHLDNLGRKPKMEQMDLKVAEIDSLSEIEEQKPIITEKVKRSPSPAPKIRRLSTKLNSDRRRKPITFKKHSKAKFGEFDSPLIMVYQVNHKNFNCKRLFNLFMGYGDVLKIKFLYDKKSTSMVEMKSISEAMTVFRYLNNFNAFGCQIRIRNSTIATSIHSHGEKFEMLCGGSSLTEFDDSDYSKRTIKRDPTYPSRKIRFSNLPLDFTDDEITKIFAKKARNGPMPKSIIRDESKKSDFLSGVMVFDNSEQATEAIMLYNFLRVSDRCILNLRFKVVF